MIKKILVANRGEIAMRIFRTCRVMNIATVAIYTRVDRGALHVRYAEEAYCISDSPEDTSYLKPEKILQIAKKTGAAIHPGYGFLSENADFARRCEEEGLSLLVRVPILLPEWVLRLRPAGLCVKLVYRSYRARKIR